MWVQTVKLSDFVAQLVEQRPFKPSVPGSSPGEVIKENNMKVLLVGGPMNGDTVYIPEDQRIVRKIEKVEGHVFFKDEKIKPLYIEHIYKVKKNTAYYEREEIVY